MEKSGGDIETGQVRNVLYNFYVDKMSSDWLPINYPLYFVWHWSHRSQGITMEISTGWGSHCHTVTQLYHSLSHCLLIGQCSDLVQITNIPLFYFPQQQTQTCRTFQSWIFLQRNVTFSFDFRFFLAVCWFVQL